MLNAKEKKGCDQQIESSELDNHEGSTSGDDDRRLHNITLALNTAGSMSTFAAGYLYFNIITYESDVLRVHDDEIGKYSIN